jgi:hypothetical protein
MTHVKSYPVLLKHVSSAIFLTKGGADHHHNHRQTQIARLGFWPCICRQNPRYYVGEKMYAHNGRRFHRNDAPYVYKHDMPLNGGEKINAKSCTSDLGSPSRFGEDYTLFQSRERTASTLHPYDFHRALKIPA